MSTATAVLGVWQRGCAGAFLYGLFLVSLDLLFFAWRVRRGQKVPPGRIMSFLGFSFLGRVSLLLAGMAVALRLFGPPGRLVVGLTLLLGVPLGIPVAKRLFAAKEG
ncbi:MAG: hypothetical protein ACUVRM_08330 [Bacillota bacterium]